MLLGPNPSVDQMLIKDRHVLKGVWIMGNAALRSVWVALGGNLSVLYKILIKDRHVLKGVCGLSDKMLG